MTAFLAVIRTGSVTAAADSLVVTQPSVSSAIHALSKELRCDLFERSGRGITPTSAGVAFAPYAEDIIGLLSIGSEAAKRAAHAADCRLQIAAVTTAAESFVPNLMRAFADAHPEVELSLIVGNNEEIVRRVLARQDDVAIAGQPPTTERLHAEPFLENEIVCITFPDDPVVGGGPIAASALADRPWLLREQGSGTRALNERFLVHRNLAPRTLILGSNGAIKQAVRAELGVSLMSRAAVAPELSSGWLAEVELTDGPPHRRWFALRSTVGPINPTVELFIEFVRAAGSASWVGAPPAM